MSTNTAATMEMEPSSRRLFTGTHVFLNVTAAEGIRNNGTCAKSFTRNKVPIQVSFVFESPPQLSTMFVQCSDLNPFADDPPEVVRSVDDLLVLRVNVGRFRTSLSPTDCDYFIYRAYPSRPPSLELLQRPHPFFHKCDFGILPRPDGHYTLAALVKTSSPNSYNLHLFHSDTASSGWSSSLVQAPPVQPFPVVIPRKCHRLLCHDTTTVISIGGERGTMGWVDLWHRILLCDVLDTSPTLRAMPLPLPLEKMSKNSGLGVELGYPGYLRDISFIRDKGCFKFVHMEMTSNRMPGYEIAFRVDDWKLTTWCNKEMMSDSLDNWKEGITVEASKISIDHDPAIFLALQNTGLLCEPHDSEEVAAKPQGLQNLMMYQPTLACDNSGEDVIYLMARKKFDQPEAWMIAVEIKCEGRLRGVAYCGPVTQRFVNPTYSSSTISKHLNLKLKNPATIRVNMRAEELDQDGGLENPDLLFEKLLSMRKNPMIKPVVDS